MTEDWLDEWYVLLSSSRTKGKVLAKFFKIILVSEYYTTSSNTEMDLNLRVASRARRNHSSLGR